MPDSHAAAPPESNPSSSPGDTPPPTADKAGPRIFGRKPHGHISPTYIRLSLWALVLAGAFKILVEGSNSDFFVFRLLVFLLEPVVGYPWIAACINFALMSVAVSWNLFGGKGFVAGLAAWLLVAGAIWGPYRFSMPRKLHAPVGEDAVWAAARGTDLPAFQRAVDGCGLDCSPAMIQTLYNVLAMRGNIAFVRDLQARSPTHLSSLAEASHHRARLEAGRLLYCATGARVGHHLDGMTAALFGPLPALRQLMLDYAAPHELHNGLHYAIRADAPERVAELLQRGASLERAVLMSYDNHRLQAARASRLALVELLIEARAARVLKWFLTDGRAHLDALDATRNKGEADALHLWARAASQHEARFGTLDSHLPVLDGLLAEPAFRDTAPLDPQACRDNCQPAGFKTPKSIYMQVEERCLQCGPVELAWGAGGVGSVKALIDRGLPISSDHKRRKLILAALQAPTDPEVGKAQQMRLRSYQGEAATPDANCMDAFLAEQAAGPQQR